MNVKLELMGKMVKHMNFHTEDDMCFLDDVFKIEDGLGGFAVTIGVGNDLGDRHVGA